MGEVPQELLINIESLDKCARDLTGWISGLFGDKVLMTMFDQIYFKAKA